MFILAITSLADELVQTKVENVCCWEMFCKWDLWKMNVKWFKQTTKDNSLLNYFLAFMRPVQTAQEEDACSCRFPEEEEGVCELWRGNPQMCWNSLEKNHRRNMRDPTTVPFKFKNSILDNTNGYPNKFFFLNANDLAFQDVPLLTEQKNGTEMVVKVIFSRYCLRGLG